MNQFFKKTDAFLFQHKAVQPFGFLRIATAFLCLLLLLSIAGDMQNLIGLNGYVGRAITETTIGSKILPRISWLINPLVHIGLSDTTAVDCIIWLYLTAILFMLAGLFTKPAVFIVWIIHFMILQSTQQFSYGADFFINLLLFYCLIMPTGKYYSLDAFFLKSEKKTTNLEYESFCIRILQIHLCIGYFFGGLSKLITPGWLSADAIWHSLMLPGLKVVDFSFLANYPITTTILGCSVVALELLYPLMIYINKTRRFWLIAILLMHLFIGIFMSLPFFGLAMILFNIAAFGWNELKNSTP